MIRRLSVSGLVLMTAISASAQGVDPKVHQMCIEAKDYAGCVRAMTSDITSPQVIRNINQRGAVISEGNQCPSGFAYVGSGNCMEVKCQYHRSVTTRSFGHDKRVAGKPGWGCKHSFWYGAGTMTLEGNARTSVNPNCPPGEPKIGYNSTCTVSSLTTSGNGRKADTSDWNSSPNDYVLNDD